MPLQQFDEKQAVQLTDQWTDASTPGDLIQLYQSGAGATLRLDTIQIFNNDTIDHTLTFSAHGSFLWPIAVGTIPAGAGYGIVPPFDVLAWNYPAANHYLTLSQAGLWWTINEAVSAGKEVAIVGFGGFV